MKKLEQRYSYPKTKYESFIERYCKFNVDCVDDCVINDELYQRLLNDATEVLDSELGQHLEKIWSNTFSFAGTFYYLRNKMQYSHIPMHITDQYKALEEYTKEFEPLRLKNVGNVLVVDETT